MSLKNVSEGVTDAVTQANVQVVGDSPSMAMGPLYQTSSHSTGIMFESAVHNQNQQNILSHAGLTQSLIQFYSLDTLSGSITTSKILNSPVLSG